MRSFASNNVRRKAQPRISCFLFFLIISFLLSSNLILIMNIEIAMVPSPQQAFSVFFYNSSFSNLCSCFYVELFCCGKLNLIPTLTIQSIATYVLIIFVDFIGIWLKLQLSWLNLTLFVVLKLWSQTWVTHQSYFYQILKNFVAM